MMGAEFSDPERGRHYWAKARPAVPARSVMWSPRLSRTDKLRPDGIPFAVGSVWTTSDYLIREGKAPVPAFAQTA